MSMIEADSGLKPRPVTPEGKKAIKASVTEREQVTTDFWEKSTGFYNAWYLARGRRRSKGDIVDMRFGPKNELEDWLEQMIRGQADGLTPRFIVDRLDSFSQQAKYLPANTPDEIRNRNFILAQLNASRLYAVRTGGEKGEAIDPRAFTDVPYYIEGTQGLQFRSIPDIWMDRMHRHVAKLFEETTGVSYTQENVQAFKSAKRISPEEFLAILSDNDEEVAIISRFVGLRMAPQIRSELDDVRDEWVAYADTDPDDENRYRLRVNTNKARVNDLTEHKARAFRAHEIAHIVQAEAFKKQYRNTFPTPTMLGVQGTHALQPVPEGWGQTVPYFIPELRVRLGQEGILSFATTGLRNMADHNLHVAIHSPNFDYDKAWQKYRSFVPDASETNFEQTVKEKTNDPLEITYGYAYGSGYMIHTLIASMLSERGHHAFAVNLHRGQMTPTHEVAYVERLLKEGKYREERISEAVLEEMKQELRAWVYP